MIKETKKKEPIRFLHSEAISISVIKVHDDYVVDYVARIMQYYSKMDYLLGAHNTGDNWILLIICLKWNLVWYLDSSRPVGRKGKPRECGYSIVKGLLDV